MDGEVTEAVFCQKASSLVSQTFLAPVGTKYFIDTQSTYWGLELDPQSSRPGPVAEYLSLLGKFFHLPNQLQNGCQNHPPTSKVCCKDPRNLLVQGRQTGSIDRRLCVVIVPKNKEGEAHSIVLCKLRMSLGEVKRPELYNQAIQLQSDLV